MAGRVTVLTPKDESEAIELGRSTWRKQILPVGSLDYSGRKLNFTREYLNDIVSAFKSRAFDAVPLQLADASNSHTNEPDRAAGEVIGLEATDQGLFATVSTTDKGSQILRDHPNLGVSVRLVEDYVRQDGKSTTPHKAALQHVLATWAPRVSGMAPWQAVECSEETDEVLDLSALTFTPDGDAQPQENASPADPGGQTPTHEESPVTALNEEELAAVRSIFPLIKKLAEPDETVTETEVKPEAVVTPIKADPAVEVDEDAEVEQAIAAAVEPDEDKTVDLALVELRTAADRQAIELAELKAERDEEKWKYEREQLVRDYGIPPAIVALAEPLLKGSKYTVELSQGGSVDAGSVLRNVLHTVAKTYGRGVDLSGPLGSAYDGDGAEDEAKAARKRIHDAANAAGLGK